MTVVNRTLTYINEMCIYLQTWSHLIQSHSVKSPNLRVLGGKWHQEMRFLLFALLCFSGECCESQETGKTLGLWKAWDNLARKPAFEHHSSAAAVLFWNMHGGFCDTHLLLLPLEKAHKYILSVLESSEEKVSGASVGYPREKQTALMWRLKRVVRKHRVLKTATASLWKDWREGCLPPNRDWGSLRGGSWPVSFLWSFFSLCSPPNTCSSLFPTASLWPRHSPRVKSFNAHAPFFCRSWRLFNMALNCDPSSQLQLGLFTVITPFFTQTALKNSELLCSVLDFQWLLSWGTDAALLSEGPLPPQTQTSHISGVQSFMYYLAP